MHITGTPIWCDARRRRDVCFVSSADRVGRTGHGQLIGTAITLALIGARDKGHLAVPLRQRFTLGTTRLELIPSGRGFGAAALHVDIAGKTVLYAGQVRTSVGGVGDAAELRSCDAVVVAAPYGEPHQRFPSLGAEIASTIAWTRNQLASGRRPVLFVDSLLDGLEVASRLAAEGIPIAGARALREAGQRIADLVPSPQRIDGAIAIGATLPQRSLGRDARDAADAQPPLPDAAIPPIPPPGREPRAIVWLDADRAGLARALGDRRTAGPKEPDTVAASLDGREHEPRAANRGRGAAAGTSAPGAPGPAPPGEDSTTHEPDGPSQSPPTSPRDRQGSSVAGAAVAGEPGMPSAPEPLSRTSPDLVTALVSARATAGSDGYDAGFVWAAAADHLQLLAWIEATGARDVFVTGPYAEAIVAALGPRARVIGPPHQMSLFPREAFS